MFTAKNLSILLVDINADLIQYWSTALDKSFKGVYLAGHAYAGLETLHRQKIDIVIAGKQLPEMDGFAFCQELKRESGFSSLPVVLYKPGFVTLEDKYLAAKSGAELIISQPASVEDLIDTAINVYSGSRAQSAFNTQAKLNDSDARSEGYADFLTQKLGDTINQLQIEQQSLNTALSRFKDFAYSVGDYFWETDAEIRLTFLGSGPENKLALPTGHYQNCSFSEFFKEFLNKEGLSDFSKMAVSEQPLEVSCELESQSGLRRVKVIGNPYYSATIGFNPIVAE